MNQPTGRPDYNWEEFGTKESVEKMKKERTEQREAWSKRISKTGLNSRTLAAALENAGAAGIIFCNCPIVGLFHLWRTYQTGPYHIC